MKVAKSIQTAAWLFGIAGVTVTILLGIQQAKLHPNDILSTMLYFLIGLVSSLVGFVMIYGFGNIVNYCEINSQSESKKE